MRRGECVRLGRLHCPLCSVCSVLYGMGADSLSHRLSKILNRPVTTHEAQSHITKLFDGFPALKLFMSETKAGGAQTGFVPTLAHRRRYLPDLRQVDCSGVRKAYAQRQAVNTVIQGSAADMTKMVRDTRRSRAEQQITAAGLTIRCCVWFVCVVQAMIGLSRHIRSTPSLHGSVWLVMQLHDEIVLELPERLTHEVAEAVRSVMENIIPESGVAFPVHIKIGHAMGSMHDL